jgi:hypothetical protein
MALFNFQQINSNTWKKAIQVRNTRLISIWQIASSIFVVESLTSLPVAFLLRTLPISGTCSRNGGRKFRLKTIEKSRLLMLGIA